MKFILILVSLQTVELPMVNNDCEQTYMKNVKFRISSSLENTDHIMNNTFWIGCYPGLDETMLNYVIEKVEAFFGLDL